MGVLATCIAALFSTSRDLVSKRVSSSVDGIVSACASFLFALPYYVLLLTVLWFFGFETFAFSNEFLLLVVLRSLTDAFAEWLKMRSLGLGEISLVSPFFSLSPLFLLVTSPIITGDPVSIEGAGAIVLIVLGVLIIGKSPVLHARYAHTRWAAVWTAVASAFFLSLNSCFDRLAVQIASPSLSAASMTLLTFLLLFPFCVQPNKFKQFMTASKWFSVRGFFEVGFMVLKLYALQYVPAHYVMGLLKISLLLSIVGGRVFYKEGAFMHRIVGGLFISTGIAVIILYEL